MRRLVLPLALLSLLLLLPAQASAATGDLSFKDCIAKFAVGACTAVPNQETFEGGRDVAVSPDGRYVFVADGTDSVLAFTRSGQTGAVTYAGCIDSGGSAPCTHTAKNVLQQPRSIASVTDAVVSPDNASLYAVAFQDSALSTFGLLTSPAGKLSFIRCLRANEVQGCTGFGTSSAMSQPLGVAISPDGHDVYVANNSGGVSALLHFERDAPGARPGEEEPGEEEPGPDPGGGGATGGGTGQTPGPGGKQPTPVVRCNGLKATIVGTAGRDNLRGTKKKDVIAAGAGNDKVDALAGKDVVCGEGGNDKLGGGPDADVLLGGPGRDLLKGAGGPDRMLGGPGADTLLGGPGRDSAKQ